MTIEETTATVIPNEDGKPAAVVVELPTEEITEPVTEDAAVAIAAIEADRDITIAAIEADASVAREESYAEARIAEAEAPNEREREWTSRIDHLEAENLALRGRVENLEALSVPVSLVEEMAAETAEEATAETLTALAPDGTPISTTPTSEEIGTAHGVESEEEPLVPPLVEVDVPNQPKRVIRLV